MENISQYIERKRQEFVLFDECLTSSLRLRAPNSIADIIRCKFRLAAALKAEHALGDWALTETDWAHAPVFRSGPFQFTFDYQRADLQVSGPPIYPGLAAFGCVVGRGIYTGSAMGALAAILLAMRRISRGVDVVAPEGCYSETLELFKNFGVGIRVVRGSPVGRASQKQRDKILLVDSSIADGSFSFLNSDDPQRYKLVLFDTTCFWSRSGRINRLFNRFIENGLPVLLVRSHTKLDSLGVEYGRLGSIVLAVPRTILSRFHLRWLEQLVKTIFDAVRLTGGAVTPAHFPPFVGSEHYAELGSRRVAAIQSNTRRLSRWLRERVPESARIDVVTGAEAILQLPTSPRSRQHAIRRQTRFITQGHRTRVSGRLAPKALAHPRTRATIILYAPTTARPPISLAAAFISYWSHGTDTVVPVLGK